jgi:hypothetical protein
MGVPKYRIMTSDRKILNAGTDDPSWFDLERAREVVDRSKGQIIVEHNGVGVLWEVL